MLNFCLLYRSIPFPSLLLFFHSAFWTMIHLKGMSFSERVSSALMLMKVGKIFDSIMDELSSCTYNWRAVTMAFGNWVFIIAGNSVLQMFKAGCGGVYQPFGEAGRLLVWDQPGHGGEFKAAWDGLLSACPSIHLPTSLPVVCWKNLSQEKYPFLWNLFSRKMWDLCKNWARAPI